MAKSELPVAQSDAQKRKQAIASIVHDVFERVEFPADRQDLLSLAGGVELQAGRNRFLMLSDLIEGGYKERFDSLNELVEFVQSAVEAA